MTSHIFCQFLPLLHPCPQGHEEEVRVSHLSDLIPGVTKLQKSIGRGKGSQGVVVSEIDGGARAFEEHAVRESQDGAVCIDKVIRNDEDLIPVCGIGEIHIWGGQGAFGIVLNHVDCG